MKKLLTILMLSLTGLTFCQTQWDYLGGWPIEMNSQVASCMYFDFEQNGSNEVKIVHGDAVGCYFTSCTSTPAYMPTHVKTEDKIPFWSDCSNSNLSGWTSDTAYIAKSCERLSAGSHVLPFKYGNKYGFFILKLEAGSDTLKVRGNVFLINPKNFTCYELSDSLTRSEISPRTFKE